jgi:ribosomal protein S18 acetylase RimI-like enzyme
MLDVRPIDVALDAEACARLMSTSDPWLTLGRTFEESLAVVSDPAREVYVASRDGAFAGFLVLNMRGAFVGYIQTVCIVPELRGSGAGTELVRFAEERIFRESPNVFMCVSDFNPRARALYERLGYRVVGELTDFIVSGRSEILLRKTIAPLREWRRPG